MKRENKKLIIFLTMIYGFVILFEYVSYLLKLIKFILKLWKMMMSIMYCIILKVFLIKTYFDLKFICVL